MPAEPPPVKIVGQSSFVDFGENLEFPVIFDKPIVFVCDCDSSDRSLLNLACASMDCGDWECNWRDPKCKRKHKKSVCKSTQDA